MPIAIGIWSLIIKAGSPETFVPASDVRITNISLGAELADETSRTSVTLTYQPPVSIDSDDEDEEAEPSAANSPSTTVLCSLTPGKIENALIDLVLEEDEEYVFKLIGKNTIYLSGNYIDQVPTDQVPFNDMDDSEDEEGAYRLDEVSSDVEIDPEDLDSDSERFEEIAEEAVKSLKRARDTDAMDTDEAKSVSKADKKQKKLKGEDGKAVPAGESLSTASTTEKKSKKEKKAEKAAAAEKAGVSATPDTKKPTERELPGGIKIQDIKIGTGAQAKKGSRIGMRYIGKLLNGKEFDKNVKGKPFSFRLGAGEVIKGWDEGLVGMQVGGERILTLPPKVAYGKSGTDGIPPNSTLIFECKLVELK